jgi:hypothetical protein
LEIIGEQEVVFCVNNVKYEHRFLVCSLPTKPAGILGMGFLLIYEVQMNLGKQKINSYKLPKLLNGSLK